MKLNRTRCSGWRSRNGRKCRIGSEIGGILMLMVGMGGLMLADRDILKVSNLVLI